jgi:hypothetical protein
MVSARGTSPAVSRPPMSFAYVRDPNNRDHGVRDLSGHDVVLPIAVRPPFVVGRPPRSRVLTVPSNRTHRGLVADAAIVWFIISHRSGSCVSAVGAFDGAVIVSPFVGHLDTSGVATRRSTAVPFGTGRVWDKQGYFPASQPPSTGSVIPVTIFELSEHSQTTASA